jgi:glutathione peroxidase
LVILTRWAAIEIETFYHLNFGVDFPLTVKIKLKGKGKEQHKLYQWLTIKAKTGRRILQ